MKTLFEYTCYRINDYFLSECRYKLRMGTLVYFAETKLTELAATPGIYAVVGHCERVTATTRDRQHIDSETAKDSNTM